MALGEVQCASCGKAPCRGIFKVEACPEYNNGGFFNVLGDYAVKIAAETEERISMCHSAAALIREARETREAEPDKACDLYEQSAKVCAELLEFYMSEYHRFIGAK